MFDFKKLVARYLRETADKIDAGTSEISENEAMDILGVIAHEVMSKAQASSYLNVSIKRFDGLLRERKIPQGKKRVGFKEKVFYRDELDMAIRKMKDGKKK